MDHEAVPVTPNRRFGGHLGTVVSGVGVGTVHVVDSEIDDDNYLGVAPATRRSLGSPNPGPPPIPTSSWVCTIQYGPGSVAVFRTDVWPNRGIASAPSYGELPGGGQAACWTGDAGSRR